MLLMCVFSGLAILVLDKQLVCSSLGKTISPTVVLCMELRSHGFPPPLSILACPLLLFSFSSCLGSHMVRLCRLTLVGNSLTANFLILWLLQTLQPSSEPYVLELHCRCIHWGWLLHNHFSAFFFFTDCWRPLKPGVSPSRNWNNVDTKRYLTGEQMDTWQLLADTSNPVKYYVASIWISALDHSSLKLLECTTRFNDCKVRDCLS